MATKISLNESYHVKVCSNSCRYMLVFDLILSFYVDLASYILQRTPCCARRAPGVADRDTPQPKSQPRKDDPDHV